MSPPVRVTALLALFVASFLAVSAVVRAALGWPDVSGVRKKAVFCERDEQGFDVLFVGSSNVMNSVLPELFDAELEARGYDLRSYNLGLPGMLSFETDFMLQEVLASRTDRLRWVFVELADWKPGPRIAEKTARGVYWHTPERVVAMADAAFHYADMSTRERLEFVRDHVELALWRLTNVGRVQETAQIELGVKSEDNWNKEIEPGREMGYVALEESGNAGAAAGRERFLADKGAYWRSLLALRKREAGPGPAPEYLTRSAERRLAFFDGTGVEPIHVTFATTWPSGELDKLGPPHGPLPVLWAYNRPDEHPELYELDVRFDDRHLQRPGAELLTRDLARRFADRLDARSAPSNR